MEEYIKGLYTNVRDYSRGKGLTLTLRVLEFLEKTETGRVNGTSLEKRFAAETEHCLEVTQMLTDLDLPISAEEKEILLPASLLHFYPELFGREAFKEKASELGLGEDVTDLIRLILPGKNLTDEELHAYYDRVQENRLALLIVLSDRGNILQNLYRYSTWNAHRYIQETKACYYPMCVYGKEHYYEIFAAISILMEKMRSLIEVSEILLMRYETREAELIQDILALREENATIKGIIAKFKSEN